MGVKGLWEILSYSKKYVNIESLRNKTLAIDVSIWIYEFIKAMRDDSGNMIRGAHIIGCIRRICKLLYYDIKPIFVFDGGVSFRKRKEIRRRRLIQDHNRQKSTLLALKDYNFEFPVVSEEEEEEDIFEEVELDDPLNNNDLTEDEWNLIRDSELRKNPNLKKLIYPLPSLNYSNESNFSKSQLDRLCEKVNRKTKIEQFRKENSTEITIENRKEHSITLDGVCIPVINKDKLPSLL